VYTCGGFVSGSAAAYKGYGSMLAKYSGCKVFAVDYALALY
ncbi:MAG: alpha/beta hydrolase, partial [Lachnospiraceae bacterium]|nr:alpha/beta hydrolase [Lachnospiraceae bacterium]